MWECFRAILPLDEFGKNYQRLEASGIYHMWMREIFGMGQALRVQDRVKFRGPTIIVDDREEVIPLNLQDKIGRAFVMWTVCFSICMTLWCLEMTHFRVTMFANKCWRGFIREKLVKLGWDKHFARSNSLSLYRISVSMVLMTILRYVG